MPKVVFARFDMKKAHFKLGINTCRKYEGMYEVEYWDYNMTQLTY